MRVAAVLAAVVTVSTVSGQGYNSTSSTRSTSHYAVGTAYDSRTVNVPPPSRSPTTALTSIYTITSSCGTVQILLPATSIFPLSTRVTATFEGPSSSSAVAVKTQAAALVGAGGLMAAAIMLL